MAATVIGKVPTAATDVVAIGVADEPSAVVDVGLDDTVTSAVVCW